MAEVRLTGTEIKPDHLERLRQYLDLAKGAIASDDDSVAAGMTWEPDLPKQPPKGS